MSNLVGDAYDLPCPRCGTPMGNAAGLGLCGRCQMRQTKIPSDSLVGFLEGFQPIDLPLIKAPMMRAYGVRTSFNKATETLTITKRYYDGRIHDEFLFENDDEEFYPASDREEQARFLKKLSQTITDYNHNLMVICLRRGTGGSDNEIGMVPEVNLGFASTNVIRRQP